MTTLRAIPGRRNLSREGFAPAQPRLAPGEPIFPDDEERPFTRPGARQLQAAQSAPPAPPQTPEEARARFSDRYMVTLAAALLGCEIEEPATVAEWMALARAVRDTLEARAVRDTLEAREEGRKRVKGLGL